jgi:hypothetical protein
MAKRRLRAPTSPDATCRAIRRLSAAATMAPPPPMERRRKAVASTRNTDAVRITSSRPKDPNWKAAIASTPSSDVARITAQPHEDPTTKGADASTPNTDAARMVISLLLFKSPRWDLREFHLNFGGIHQVTLLLVVRIIRAADATRSSSDVVRI